MPDPDPSLAFPTPGTPRGRINIFSNHEVHIHAGVLAGLDPISLVRLGQYPDGTPVSRQAGTAELMPSILNLGRSLVGPLAPAGTHTPTTLPTLQVNIHATAIVKIQSDTLVQVDAPSVIVNAATSAMITTTLANITASTKAEIFAPLVELAGPGAIGNVVTTQTHPVDSFTGAPILGTSKVLAGGP